MDAGEGNMSRVIPPSGGRASALAIVLGGFAALLGSLQSWGTCPDTACGEEGSAFFVLVPKSGIDFGPGVVTALLGFSLVLTGIYAFRRGGASPLRAPALLLALMVLVTVGAYVVRMYVFPEFLLYGPEIGVYLVAGGGLIAVAASLRWRVRADQSPALPN